MIRAVFDCEPVGIGAAVMGAAVVQRGAAMVPRVRSHFAGHGDLIARSDIVAAGQRRQRRPDERQQRQQGEKNSSALAVGEGHGG